MYTAHQPKDEHSTKQHIQNYVLVHAHVCTLGVHSCVQINRAVVQRVSITVVYCMSMLCIQRPSIKGTLKYDTLQCATQLLYICILVIATPTPSSLGLEYSNILQYKQIQTQANKTSCLFAEKKESCVPFQREL